MLVPPTVPRPGATASDTAAHLHLHSTRVGLVPTGKRTLHISVYEDYREHRQGGTLQIEFQVDPMFSILRVLSIIFNYRSSPGS